MSATGARPPGLRPAGRRARPRSAGCGRPLVLALAVWMFVRMRRALTGRGRWLLTPVVVVLGPRLRRRHRRERRRRRATRTPTPAPGTTYDVGGHRLHLDCRGQGSPTVVLFNGLGEISASWARIADQVGATTRVCAYDRAGQGWSDDVASPQDGVDRRRGPARPAGRGRRARPLRAGRALHRRPLRHDLRRPVPRAGRRHGAAGQLQPRAVHRDPQLPRPVRRDAARRSALPAHAGRARAGSGRRRRPPTCPRPAADAGRGADRRPRAAPGTCRDELSVAPRGLRAGAGAHHPRRPAARRADRLRERSTTAGWAAAQDRLAALSDRTASTGSSTSTHAACSRTQHGAAASVRAITDVVAAVRTGIR